MRYSRVVIIVNARHNSKQKLRKNLKKERTNEKDNKGQGKRNSGGQNNTVKKQLLQTTLCWDQNKWMEHFEGQWDV